MHRFLNVFNFFSSDIRQPCLLCPLSVTRSAFGHFSSFNSLQAPDLGLLWCDVHVAFMSRVSHWFSVASSLADGGCQSWTEDAEKPAEEASNHKPSTGLSLSWCSWILVCSHPSITDSPLGWTSSKVIFHSKCLHMYPNDQHEVESDFLLPFNKLIVLNGNSGIS